MDARSADGPGPRPDDAAAQPVAVLAELLDARGEELLRTAVLLTGSRADGETLYHLAADGWRRNGAWRATAPARPPGLLARRQELTAPIPKGFREAS